MCRTTHKKTTEYVPNYPLKTTEYVPNHPQNDYRICTEPPIKRVPHENKWSESHYIKLETALNPSGTGFQFLYWI